MARLALRTALVIALALGGLPLAALGGTPDAVKRNNLGSDFVKQGRLEEALKEFGVAVELDPAFAAAQANLAYVLDRLGRADDAIAAYKKTLTLEPGNVVALNNLGVLYTKKGQYDEAIRTLERGLEIDPSNGTLRKSLDTAQHNKAIGDEREQRVAEARKKGLASPRDPDVAYQTARVLAFYGQRDEALEWLQRSLQFGHHNPGMFKSDPALTSLRGDPRFDRLLGTR